MHRQHRSQFNTIHAASLARWIVLFAFVAVAGLIYVYQTVQLNHLGNEKKALENELTTARLQNVEAAGQIATLTSRAALQRRLKEGYLKMVPVAEGSIVRLSPTAGRPNEDGVQPVVNQRVAR
ncbi:MAG: hypothetical protein M3Y80_02190 [Verrucomicrobiota bacterium]|nr:hypothetical protein [Verrucomicrobiota bacterium]